MNSSPSQSENCCRLLEIALKRFASATAGLQVGVGFYGSSKLPSARLLLKFPRYRGPKVNVTSEEGMLAKADFAAVKFCPFCGKSVA